MNPDWFKQLFTGGRPHRRDFKVRVGTDAAGNPVFHRFDGHTSALSPEDSVDSFEVEVPTYEDCGCNARTNEIGGRCGEPDCQRVMCDKCWPRCRCADCGKPCCLAHLYYLDQPDGTRVPLCRNHHTEAKKRRFWKRVREIAVRPLLEIAKGDS